MNADCKFNNEINYSKVLWSGSEHVDKSKMIIVGICLTQHYVLQVPVKLLLGVSGLMISI